MSDDVSDSTQNRTRRVNNVNDLNGNRDEHHLLCPGWRCYVDMVGGSIYASGEICDIPSLKLLAIESTW